MANPQLLIEVAAKDETTRVLKGIESSIIRFVGAISATLAAVGVVVFPISNAAEFQKEMLNVAKTTDFTNVQLEQLSTGLKDLSTKLNVATIDLVKIAAAGGQLGLGREGVQGLITYTETTARFAAVLDVSAEEAGTAIGKLANIFNIAISDAERISSTLNEISNNSTATGRELIDIIQRIGTAGGTLGLQQSAALAAYGKDLGLTSETVGTTLNKIFLDLQSKAEKVAPLVGLTVTEFANLVKTDGVAAFKLYVDSLRKMDNVSRAIISETITGGGKISAFITAAVGDSVNGFKLLDRELASTKKGYETGTSAMEEHARVMQGLLAQVTILKNVFNNLAETVGRAALPYLTALVKQLQAVGQDPQFINFFTTASVVIGEAFKGVVSFVQSLNSLGFVLGPLARILGVVVAFKLGAMFISAASSLARMSISLGVTTKAWFDLVTVNLTAIKTNAQLADTLDATNKKLEEEGKVVKTRVSLYGRASQAVAGFFAPAASAQDAAIRAETLLTDRLTQRNTVLGAILQRMQDIRRTSAQQAQDAYDSVINAGGTKKAAKDASKSISVALKKEFDDLDVRGTNLFNSYETAINRLKAAYISASAQAVTMGQTVAGVMLRVANSVRSAIATVFALGQSFLVVASRILGAIFVVQALLELFGVLQPALRFLRELFGIRTEEEAAASRAAQERDAAMIQERKRAAELSREYLKLKEVWDAQDKAGKTSLSDVGARLEVIGGRIADLQFSSQEFTANLAFSGERAAFLAQRIEEVQKRLDGLKSGKLNSDFLAIGQEILFPSLPADLDRAQKEIDKTAKELQKLRSELDLVKAAQKSYADNIASGRADVAEARGRELREVSKLATAYNAEGYALLKQLEIKLAKQKELAQATKELGDIQSAGKDKSTNTSDLAEFTTLEQKVRGLKTELDGLSTGFDVLYKKSSIAAVGFLNTLGIDNTTVSLDKVSKKLREFSGIAGEGGGTLNSSFLEASRGVDKIGAAYDKALAKRKSLINGINILVADGTLSAESGAKEEAKINEEYSGQIARLREKLAVQLAARDIAQRELEDARLLHDAFGGLNTVLTSREQTETRIAALVANAGKLDLVKNRIAAQKAITDNAQFNATRIKDLYEASLKDVSKAVASVASDLADVGRQFASRKLTIKLSVFDANAERQAQVFKDFQQDSVNEERKRLEALGLSSEEISLQMRSYERMVELASKMRQEQVDSQRLDIQIKETKSDIGALEEKALGHQRVAASLARSAKEALDSGDSARADAVGKQIAVETELAKEALSSLTAKVKEFQDIAQKPVSTQFGAQFKVTQQEVEDITRKAAETRVEVTNSASTSLEVATRQAADQLNVQNAAMSALTKELGEYNAAIAQIVGKDADLARIVDLVGKAASAQVAGVAEANQFLKSIAETDFRGITDFSQLADKAENFKQIENSIGNVANTSAKKIADISTAMGDLPKSLIAAFGITEAQIAQAERLAKEASSRALAESEKIKAAQTTAITDAKTPTAVTFPDAKKSLETALNDGDPVVAKVKISPSAQGHAEGGWIRGKGTGTSDSILSWLSNGEYVSDARTTSFFGPSFFATLKRIARGGYGLANSLVPMLAGSPRLPAFAGGGLVSSQMVKDAAGAFSSRDAEGSRDTVNVSLELSGKKIDMRAERDQANELVRTIRNLSRSL